MLNEFLQGSSPVYFYWGIAMIALSILLVPREQYRQLIPYALAGTGIVYIVLTLASKVFKAWEYIEVEPFSLFGTPIFVLAAWGATFIIFLWALPRHLPVWIHYVYISFYGFMGVILDYFFHQYGLRPYAPWYNGWMWFFPVTLVFYLSYKIYQYVQVIPARSNS